MSNNYAAKKAYQDKQQAEAYDAQRFTSLRGRIGNMLDQVALKKALKQLGKQINKASIHLLDLPCGTGRMTKYLLENGYTVTGADVSQEMMAVAAEKIIHLPNFAGFQQTDAANMPFHDNQFDSVISIRFIGHIPKEARIQMLREYARVSPYAIIEYSLQSRTVKWRRQIDYFLKTGSRLPVRWPWHIFTQTELKTELAQANLKIINKWAKLPLLSDSYYILVQRQ